MTVDVLLLDVAADRVRLASDPLSLNLLAQPRFPAAGFEAEHATEGVTRLMSWLLSLRTRRRA
jgi:hypothetical protein